MLEQNQNIDPREVAKFDEIAHRWWDKESEFKPLHDINPLRLQYVQQRVKLENTKVLDVGCGGGIFSESMAKQKAIVTGIDQAEGALNVAKLHLYESKLEVEYLHITVEELAAQRPAQYDVVTCMEMLEHVPDPESIVNACAALVKPGGNVFFSTINRNPKAYTHAILGAEYILKMLPKGTHDYRKFIKPSELGTWIRHAGLDLTDVSGMSYNPIFRNYALSKSVDVNYLVACEKPAD